MSNYWQDRMSKAQDTLTQKHADKTNKQIAKYYSDAMKNTINSFEKTYQKILIAVEKGETPTPADLYKLDTYWQTQAELREELQKLGSKQVALMSRAFENQYLDIYNSIALPAGAAFSTPSKEAVNQLINAIWTADKKTWSERIWNNTERLAETLNDELVHCVITGKKTTDLKNLLQERFRVSYDRADTLVRTEMSHLQTQAAHKRYTDAGVKYFEVWGSEDERRCEICAGYHEKIYPIDSIPPIPAHPRCRCTILPVIED